MTTHRILLTAIALGSLSLEATAHAQFRGRQGGFSRPQGGGSSFVQQQGSGQRNFIQTPNQVGFKPPQINLGNNPAFRSLVPNQPGNNAPRFNFAPTQVGNNAPKAFAPSQAGNNAPRAFNLAPSQPGTNASSVNVASSGFANFNQGFGGFGSSNGFRPASQQFASTTPTSSFTQQSFQQPAQQIFAQQPAQQSFTQNSFASATQTQSQQTTALRPPVLPQQQFSNSPIRIILPKNYSLGVNYTLNQFTYAMKPGERQGFREDREWVVRFDRGLNLGTFEYTLDPGTYCFVCDSSTGWQLYEVSEETAVALVR